MKKFSCITVTLLIISVFPASYHCALKRSFACTDSTMNLEMEKILVENLHEALLPYLMFPNIYVSFYKIKPQIIFTTLQADEKKERDTITEVHVKRYASAEDNEVIHLNLSKTYTEAIKKKRWKELVDNSDIRYRDEILELMGKNHEADVRKKQIVVLDEDGIYQKGLLHAFYPKFSKATTYPMDYAIGELGRCRSIPCNLSYLRRQEIYREEPVKKLLTLKLAENEKSEFFNA